MMMFMDQPSSHRWSNSSLSSVSSNLSLFEQNAWKQLQIADVHDDDEHFKKRSSKPQVLEETDGFEADVDSPISRTGECTPSLCVPVCVCLYVRSKLWTIVLEAVRSPLPSCISQLLW